MNPPTTAKRGVTSSLSELATFGRAGANIGRALSFAFVAETEKRELPKALKRALARMVAAFQQLQGAAKDACAEIDRFEQ